MKMQIYRRSESMKLLVWFENCVLAKNGDLFEESAPFKGITLDLDELDLEKALGDTFNEHFALKRAHSAVLGNDPDHSIGVTGTHDRNGWYRNSKSVEGFAYQRDQKLQFPCGVEACHWARGHNILESLGVLGAAHGD